MCLIAGNFGSNTYTSHKGSKGQNFHDFVTELKKISSKCEFDNLQHSLNFETNHCMWYNSLHERLLPASRMQLHAAEETQKRAHKILRSQPIANIDKIFKKKLNNSQPVQ